MISRRVLPIGRIWVNFKFVAGGCAVAPFRFDDEAGQAVAVVILPHLFRTSRGVAGIERSL
jgi:hypothetical protein